MGYALVATGELVAWLEAQGWIAVERSDGWTAERVDGTRGVYAATLAELVRRIESGLR